MFPCYSQGPRAERPSRLISPLADTLRETVVRERTGLCQRHRKLGMDCPFQDQHFSATRG